MSKFLGPKAFIPKFTLLLILSLFLTQKSFANEHEAPKEESSEKPAEGEKAKNVDLPPWTEIQNKMSQLEAKMQQKRENIEKLIVEKQHVNPNSGRVKEIINSMISEHKELQTMAKDYEKTITIFKFRYPERGAKADRKYEPTDIKSLDEMEQQLGIDGRLTRNMKKLRSQYGADEELKKKKATTTPEPPKKNEKPLEESGAIIIRK